MAKLKWFTNQGRWVSEHIRTAILKFNYEIDKIDKLFIRDFTDAELNEYEKTSAIGLVLVFFFSFLLQHDQLLVQ